MIQTQAVVGRRIALTADQVDDFDLETSPPKKSDSRSASWEGGTCQVEALAPDDLAHIVHSAISDYFVHPKLAAQIEAEEADRIALLRALPAGAA